jgi:hypothetical protein
MQISLIRQIFLFGLNQQLHYYFQNCVIGCFPSLGGLGHCLEVSSSRLCPFIQTPSLLLHCDVQQYFLRIVFVDSLSSCFSEKP